MAWLLVEDRHDAASSRAVPSPKPVAPAKYSIMWLWLGLGAAFELRSRWPTYSQAAEDIEREAASTSRIAGSKQTLTGRLGMKDHVMRLVRYG